MSHNAAPLTSDDLDAVRQGLAEISVTLIDAFTDDELQGMAVEAIEGCKAGCSAEALRAAVLRTSSRIAEELELAVPLVRRRVIS